MIELLDNPYLWTGLSLVAVIVLIMKLGKQPILKWLDGEIAKIVADLDQAKQLRAEAEQTLASYRQKQQEAMQEAEAIVAQANREAERLRATAAKDLQDSMARHEQQAVERIARAEADALAEVRATTVELAIRASEQVLRDQISAAAASDYIDQALAELPKQLAKKSAA